MSRLAIGKMAKTVIPLVLMIGVLDTSGVASASTATSGPKAAPKEPAGYTVVGTDYDAPSGMTTGGSAVCPAGTVVWGGGASITGTNSLLGDINTSTPFGSGAWVADVNNTSGADLTFDVEAICANQPAKYAIESATADNPAGTQKYAQASCPKGTVVLGGGGISSSQDLAVDMNSSFPSVSKKHIGSWVTNMNNGSGADANVEAAVICAKKPKSYKMVVTPSIVNPAGDQTSTSANCAAGMPIGGGPVADGAESGVAMGTTVAYGTSWVVFENNTSLSPDSLSVYVLCAK
jgi:hypothetical protein